MCVKSFTLCACVFSVIPLPKARARVMLACIVQLSKEKNRMHARGHLNIYSLAEIKVKKV